MDKIRFGIIGIKGVGNYHCTFLSKNHKAIITSLVDTDKEAVEKKSVELGVRYFTDYRRMLDEKMVDAVIIATPHYSHAEIAVDCLNSGVHVYVEKPIANRVSEAEKMISAAKKNRVKLCVGHQYRVYRLSQTLKQLIDAGTIGNIMRVLWTWSQFRTDKYYEYKPWKSTFRDAGGGVLAYFGVHDLDLLCWIIGKPVQVTAMIGNQLHKSEVEDIACANIMFEGGAFASLQFTTNQPGVYCVRQIAGDRGIIVIPEVKSLIYDENDEMLLGTYNDSIRITAKQEKVTVQPEISWRRIRADDTDSPSEKVKSPERSRAIVMKILNPRKVLQLLGIEKEQKSPNAMPQQGRTEPIEVLLNNFINSILFNEEVIVSGESAMRAVELMNALILSAVRKRVVMLPIDRHEYDQLYEELSNGEATIPRIRR